MCQSALLALRRRKESCVAAPRPHFDLHSSPAARAVTDEAGLLCVYVDARVNIAAGKMHPDEWPSPLPCPVARLVVAGAPVTAEIEIFAWHARFSVD